MKTIISIIVAMAKDRVIGKDNDMPWGRLPVDLKHFKTVTDGHPIIMGRNTFESIGKPLPNRRNIVLSRSDIKIDGCEVMSSIEKAIELLKDEKEIFIIGGGHVYKEAIDIADKLYLTYIDLEIDGDTFFPEYDVDEFYEIDHSSSKIDEKNKYRCDFVELERINNVFQVKQRR